MKICFAICEYNPFHNGHLHHINKIKEEIKPDCLAIIMSGNFTQRSEIALLDKKAAKAKETAAKKRAEGDELTDAVRAALSNEQLEPIADIAARIEGEDVTVSKVTYRLTQLVKNGEAEKGEISIPGGEGVKARKIMGYRLIG